MREINAGISGQEQAIAPTGDIEALKLTPVIKAALAQYLDGKPLRPLQWQVFGEKEAHQHSYPVVVAATTNSGKSLVGHLLALEMVLLGKRVLILEPLRALVEEQASALGELVNFLPEDQRPQVRITTGEYRVTDDFVDDEPPMGEILVATYERFDALSRQENAAAWLSTFGLIVLDEAHMLGDTRRGVALEFSISHLLSLFNPPRLVLLSASIANPEQLTTWLPRCEVVEHKTRNPALYKKVWVLDAGEDVDAALADQVSLILAADPTYRILIFVYQKASAEKLARTLATHLSGATGKSKVQSLEACMGYGTAWYHADLSQTTRSQVRNAFIDPDGAVRVVACTTSLMMGVNLPATHVIVRDTVRPGAPELRTDEILQMLGRAGRGDRPGTGILILKNLDQAQVEQRIEELQAETLPQLQSQLLAVPGSARDYPAYEANEVLGPLLGLLARMGQTATRKNPNEEGSQQSSPTRQALPITLISLPDLQQRIELLWGGKALKNDLKGPLSTLNRWRLINRNPDDQSIVVTRLGQTMARAMLPVDTAAGLSAFIRDSLTSKPDGSELGKLSEVDLLLLVILASDRLQPLVRWSQNNETGVLNRHSTHLPPDERSLLMSLWFSSATTPHIEVFLGLLDPHTRPGLKQQEGYRKTIRSLHLALLLRDLANGIGVKNLAQTYGVKELPEYRERLQDTAIWLLHGLERLLEIPHFYYHLKTNVLTEDVLDAMQHSEAEAVQKIEENFRLISQRIFRLIGKLRFASLLGGLFRQVAQDVKRLNQERRLRDTGAKRLSAPGEKTLEKLTAAGYEKPVDIARASQVELAELGVNSRYIEMLIQVAREMSY